MPTTRSEAEQIEDVWKHLLTNILRPPTADPDGFRMVLENNGVANMFDLLEDRCDISNKEEISTWQYPDELDSPRTIKPFEIHKLMTLRDFLFMKSMELKLRSPAEMTNEQLVALKREDYDIMRTTRTYRAGSATGSNPPATTQEGGGNGNPGANNPGAPSDPNASYTSSRNTVAKEIVAFDKSIKRDASLFPILKSDEGFDQWNRGTIAQARVQAVSDILNPDYLPTTPDELELFNKKQSYMYAVFEKGLQTDTGKSIVRQFQQDFDAQKIYAKVLSHYTQSVFADLDSGKYMEYIVTADLGNGKWMSNTHSFVLHWQEQVRRYDALVEDDEKFSDSLKLTLLANAVSSIEELRQVRTQAKVLSTQTGKPVTYESYCSLLLSACAIYDKKMGMTKGPKKGQRTAYSHNIDSILDDGHYDPSNDLLEIQFRRFGPSLTKGQWQDLPPEDQERWDQFDPKAKQIILQHHKPPAKPTGMLPPKVEQRNVSFHGAEITDLPDDDPPNPLQAYMTNQSDKPPSIDKLHPANLQRMFSPQNKDNASTSNSTVKSSLTGNTENPSVREVKETIVVNGRTYTAVKHDGRHKARCVADGHLTDIPIESVYSGVVSLRGIRMILFLAELNGLEAYGTDIGNAYLEAYTTELVFIVAGPEFQELEGHILVISKALYGLRLSGKMWHSRFSAVLREENFKPCLNEPDVWLRQNGKVYEYIGVYVDDLCFAMKNPKQFADKLINKYKFKLKGTGPIQYHLGCDFVRDEHGVLCMQPKKYIDRMVEGYIRMFGEKPNSRPRSPLEENDHPEIDSSDLLGPDDTAKYQSLVGSMQWAISLGRIDIATACMTLSSFRACPRKGHLERAKRVVGYLSRMNGAMIRFRTEMPDMSDLQSFEYEWDQSIYGDVREDIPDNAPPPLGNPVILIHFIDANLYHDMLTGRSVTGILHIANQTPIDWYSKKQPRVESATYGSEFMAARTCVDQIIDVRNTFRYLGVPVVGKSYLFGDNEAVVNSSARIHSKLHKRHNALSFHRVREAIASKMVDFFHIPGKINPADILSKHWSYGKVWPLLQPLLFWSGDTLNIGNGPETATMNASSRG